MAGSRLSQLRLLRRVLVILALFVWQGVRWFIGWAVLLAFFAGADRRKVWFGQCVLDLFRNLGMTFVKVGQIMSSRPDLVPDHISQALVHLQDNVGAFSFEHVERTIQEDLGHPINELFQEFSRAPVASASVAQVHKAKLHDGRWVAVKVRRPNAMEICTFDLAVMTLVAKLLGRLPRFALASPELAVEQFGKAIAAQLDFRIEAENNLRFRRNFKDVPEVEFPEVFRPLSSERVLCMSHIEGTKILHARRGRYDTKKLARLGLSTLMKMIFEDGFVHADLHPGNIFVLPENRLAILDLGLVGELDGKHRESFASFFSAWAAQDSEKIATLLYSLAINPNADGGGFASFKSAITKFMTKYWGQKLSDIRTGKLLLELLALLRTHNVRMAPSFTIVNIAIAVTEGIGKQLDPDLDLMTEAIPYFLAHPPQSACSTAV